MFKGKTLLFNVSLPIFVGDFMGEFIADRESLVLGTRIYDDDFVAPRNALQASSNLPFLVAADDEG